MAKANQDSNDSYPARNLLIRNGASTITQLKRHKRFDNLVMLGWGQGSIFHIAAVSLPVPKVRGVINSLYRGQIQKLL